MIPPRGGRQRWVNVREVLNGIYMLGTARRFPFIQRILLIEGYVGCRTYPDFHEELQ
jgi:hypothetical protein